MQLFCDRAFSGGGGVHPNFGLGAINCTASDTIFPSKRVITNFEIHSTKLCGQINFPKIPCTSLMLILLVGCS